MLYLCFSHSIPEQDVEVDLSSYQEMSESEISDVFGEDDESDTWPVRFTRLNNKYRTVTEQKVKCETRGP